jgi:hypothetical protein
MEHIRAASRRALNAGATPKMEPGRQLINRFSKIVASEPDPPVSQTPKPVIPALHTVEAAPTATASSSSAAPKANSAWKFVSLTWRGFAFEQMLPIVVFSGVILALGVLYIRKKARDRRSSPFVPIDLPACSRDDKESFVATSDATHAALSGGVI